MGLSQLLCNCCLLPGRISALQIISKIMQVIAVHHLLTNLPMIEGIQATNLTRKLAGNVFATASCSNFNGITQASNTTDHMQIERVRLHYKSAGLRRPSREQEVLHYQWFADLGSVEAQRAVGQIFSHGALRNPEQALRYFR